MKWKWKWKWNNEVELCAGFIYEMASTNVLSMGPIEQFSFLHSKGLDQRWTERSGRMPFVVSNLPLWNLMMKEKITSCHARNPPMRDTL